jgi:hypothetical protein
MSTYVYNEVLNDVINQVEHLSPDEQIQLLEDLGAFIRRRITQPSKHNVMEFRGMAKEYWKGVDVEKFINEERNSWDG